MIPTTAKIQMASEAITVKVQEAQNPFEAFILVASGLWYFLTHYKKISVLVSGILAGGSIWHVSEDMSSPQVKTEIVAIDSSNVVFGKPDEIRFNGRLVGYTDPAIVIDKFANKPELFVRNMATKKAFVMFDDRLTDESLAEIGKGMVISQLQE